MSDKKECFFIAPIGDQGSEARQRTDKVMEYIIEEAVSDYDYFVSRADKMDEPGSITSQIIEKIAESDLVIADLTGHNPNVFYELAVRHATGEPYIQLIDSSETIPFDISDIRTIQYGLGVEEADEAKQEIAAQLDALEEEEPEFDNPISRSAEMQSLRESPDSTDQTLGELFQIVSNLDKKIGRVERRQKHESLAQQSSLSEHQPSVNLDSVQLQPKDGKLSKENIENIALITDTPIEKAMKEVEESNIEIYKG